MGHKSGKRRDQLEIISLEGLVGEDSAARQIDKLIDESDTSYFERAKVKQTGRPPYNPKDMLKLYIYGMENGIVSSRKLERECKRNIELMWLINGLKPEASTICSFRQENAENLKRFFNEFCRSLAKAGYIDGKVVGIDGTKIRANNSKRNNFSVGKLDRHIEYIEKKLTEYMGEVDKNDRIEELQERKKKYELFKKRIESGEVSEVSTVDPDSRLMKQGNNGSDVSYNVQAAVDSKHKLVIGVLVTNEPNDQGQLHKTAKAVKDNLELQAMTATADKGYYKTEDFKDCHKDNITTIVAKPEDRKPGKDIEFRKEDFRYDKESDCYHCPAGQVLKFAYEDDDGFRRYRNCKACGSCKLKSHCTKSNRREICRHKYAESAEQNDRDYANNPEIYRLRQLLCEHPFGTVKRTMGIRQFLTRGLTNVTAEAALIFLCYNLKRLRTITRNADENTGNNSLSGQFFRLITILCLKLANPFHCYYLAGN